MNAIITGGNRHSKTLVMDYAAGHDISVGQLVYVREVPAVSVFPDIDQMLEDLRPHLPSGVVYGCETFPLRKTFEELRREVARFVGIPQLLLDPQHPIR